MHRVVCACLIITGATLSTTAETRSTKTHKNAVVSVSQHTHIPGDPHSHLHFDCSTESCSADQFECSNYDCVAASTYCDASNDCKDGSDESTCLQRDNRQPFAKAPGDDSTLYAVCASGVENQDDVIASRLCRWIKQYCKREKILNRPQRCFFFSELGYSSENATYSIGASGSGNVMQVASPLPRGSVRSGRHIQPNASLL